VRSAGVLQPECNVPGLLACLKFRFVSRSDTTVVYLEIGDRTAGDVVTYPDDDLQIVQVPDGRLQVVRKDGSPF
jgi:uncharacterized cupin superfamily protein